MQCPRKEVPGTILYSFYQSDLSSFSAFFRPRVESERLASIFV
jgi:hypothetical protein